MSTKNPFSARTKRDAIAAPLRMLAAALVTAVATAAAAIMMTMSGAAADSVYTPSSGWNGKTIYLSQSCHDGNDGVPGGPCITNTGCAGFSENAQSSATAYDAITITYNGDGGLVNRGYKVIRGTGTAGQNIANSNAAGVDLHLPLHSNAQGDGSACGGSTSASNNGTHMLYYSTSGRTCGESFVARLGASSPGTNDKPVYRSNLGELTQTSAASCYIESEFHTWTAGRNWLLAEEDYAWRIGFSVDAYLGYP